MLRNKVAFITGAAGSLGSATTRKLVADGFKVLMVDCNAKIGKKVAEEIGKNVKFCAGDISSENDMANAFGEAKKNFGKVDVIVNCAGTFFARSLFNFNKTTMANLDDILEEIRVNLGGTINVVRLGAQVLFENKPDADGLRGVIINTSGFAATDGQKGQVVLSAIWGGISSMTMPLCRELSTVGIRVMTISPGLIKSNVNDIFPNKIVTSLSLMTPFPKRLGESEEFAHLVKVMIENNFLNGETVRLDGGLRMSFL